MRFAVLPRLRIKTSRDTLLIVLLLCAAAACFAVAFCCNGGTEQAITEVSAADAVQIKSVSITSEGCQLSEGGQLFLQYTAVPELTTEPIVWSSSDESVAAVDQKGKITAISNGEAIITARYGECSSEVIVSVSGDIVSDTKSAINALANDCGGTAYINARLLSEQLGRSGSEDAPRMLELLDSILAYASGNGDRTRLYDAINASGFSANVCLTAAECCHAKGETLSCDAVLSFIGDVTLARYNESNSRERFPAVYAASGSKTYPFDRVKGIFSCDSMTTANFEGTLTGSKKHRNKTFYFRGDPLYAGILPASSIDAVNLANNHSGDYLDAGFEDTVRYLGKAGVESFYYSSPLSTAVNGGSGRINVVMLGAVCIGTKIDKDIAGSLISDIRKSKSSDNVVIVNIHWGVEGHEAPEECQIELAHAMIDAGADLIVGHHPHVLQGIERYNGRYIAYSLGNFCFGGNASVSSPETVIFRAMLGREGGGMTVTGISIVPCLTTSSGTKSNNYQPKLSFGSEGGEVEALLLRRSSALDYGIKSVSRSGI